MAHTSTLQSIRGERAGTWRQRLKQRPRRSIASWLLAEFCPVCFINNSDQRPRVTLSEASCTLPRQSLIMKMPPQTCPQANLRQALLNKGWFFPDDSSLCPTDNNNKSSNNKPNNQLLSPNPP